MSSSSSSAAAASATTSAVTKTLTASPNLKIVGIILAIASGLLIGTSFVFKKKGLLRSQAGHAAGEGVAYLKSPLWWLGMSMMILGELCNFAAYAFVEAIVVTPLGALSVVVCAILSSIFLNEKLTFFGWLGCALCIIGSVIIALNGPQEPSVGQINAFRKLFLAPGFLVYGSLVIAGSLTIIFYFAPRYGKKSMLWYILVCSSIGGISVSVTTGLGAAIVQTALGDNQFKFWFIYFLLGFVVITLLTEVYYLNVALALFNTAMVTPTYYVIFTFFSIITTIILFQGLKTTVGAIITLVMGFLVICVGITILQMSKVDPTQLNKLDRRSTILLQAARNQTESMEEKSMLGVEDPGIDALRGSFGTVGSIMRARSARRMSQSSSAGGLGNFRTTNSTNPRLGAIGDGDSINGMTRHQLYDAPMPNDTTDAGSIVSSSQILKRPTIKFDSQDVVHQYHPTGAPGTPRRDANAIHEHRTAVGTGSPPPVNTTSGGYPPQPILPPSFRTESNPTPAAGMRSSDLLLDDLDDSGNTSNNVRQTLSMPALFASEHEVHSAPPTLSPRYAGVGAIPRVGGPRTDSRTLFQGSPASTAGTLLSFPSVTDSARSEAWDGQSAKSNEHGSYRGRASQKKYPRGAGDDDREESVGLFRRSGESGDFGTSQEEESPVSALSPGVRLVQPREDEGRF